MKQKQQSSKAAVNSRQNLLRRPRSCSSSLPMLFKSNGLKDIESTLGLYKAIKDKLKQNQ